MGEFRYCPSCGAEYRAGFDRCADCDIELVDEAPTAPDVSDPSHARLVDPGVELVEVYSSNGPDADMVRSYLEGHGIAAISIGDEVGAYNFSVGPLGARHVLVRSFEVTDALTLIGDAEVEGRLPHDDTRSNASGRPKLGFSTAMLAVIAVIIVVGIVLAYMPGSG